MGKSQDSVREFAFIGFLLLAVLFGMQIMSFIFGSLGTIDNFDDVTQTVLNETGAFINTTGYTLDEATQANFSGGATITEVWGNATLATAYLIPAANYTVNAVTGVIRNVTVVQIGYTDANVSYTTSHKTFGEVTSDNITFDSLQAIGNYANQSGTQFTTLGIAITLVVLVAVFLFFWVAFMGRGKKGSEGPGGFQ